MKPNVCASIQASFSSYLDGAVSGHEMQEISRHLYGSDHAGPQNGEGLNGEAMSGYGAACEDCAREFAAWRLAQDAVAMLRPAKAPADLNLKLRLAISREHARRNIKLSDRVSLAWDNVVGPVFKQVSAGVAATVVLVGSIMLLSGFVAPTQPVLANDEPLGAITAPHYLYSTVSPGAIVTGRDTAVIVEASVDNTGRVYDYNIVSGPQDESVRMQVESQLLGRVYEPASVFGVPVRGHVVVTYAGISVRG